MKKSEMAVSLLKSAMEKVTVLAESKRLRKSLVVEMSVKLQDFPKL